MNEEEEADCEVEALNIAGSVDARSLSICRFF